MRVAGIPLGVGQNTFDPSLTLALLHFDGINNTQVFLDSSNPSEVFSPISGNTGVYLSDAWAKFGGTSCYFNGASYLNAIRSQPYTEAGLFADDWQFDYWVKPVSILGSKGVFCLYSSNYNTLLSLVITSGILSLKATVASTGFGLDVGVQHQTALLANTEYHIRGLRKDGYIRLFLDGIEATTPYNIGSTQLLSNALSYNIEVGRAYRAGFPTADQFYGYTDEFRFRKEAVYTGNFTPPTAPFAA